jgi:hypothetical protein
LRLLFVRGSRFGSLVSLFVDLIRLRPVPSQIISQDHFIVGTYARSRFVFGWLQSDLRALQERNRSHQFGIAIEHAAHGGTHKCLPVRHPQNARAVTDLNFFFQHRFDYGVKA